MNQHSAFEVSAVREQSSSTIRLPKDRAQSVQLRCSLEFHIVVTDRDITTFPKCNAPTGVGPVHLQNPDRDEAFASGQYATLKNLCGTPDEIGTVSEKLPSGSNVLVRMTSQFDMGSATFVEASR